MASNNSGAADALAGKDNAPEQVFPEQRLSRFKLVRNSLWRRCLSAGVLADSIMAQVGLADPVVLISGFWRSGTTWLQESLAESLNAKTVFEPLSPEGPLRRRHLYAAGIDNVVVQHSLVHAPATPEDEMWIYLDSAFWGRTGDFSTLICRKSLLESFRRLIIAKEVRMQFNLEAAHDRYGIPIVHIRRHPAAVVSSLLKAHWGRQFDKVRFADLLPGRSRELQQFDNDVVSRISAYWAVTERFVDQTITGAPWARIISYEKAVGAPDETITELCGFIGRKQHKRPSFLTQSATTINKTSFDYHGEPRGWRKTLSKDQIVRVRAAVSQLYPEFTFD